MSSSPFVKKPNLFQGVLELLGIMFLRFPVKFRIWIGILLIVNMGGIFLDGGMEVKIIAGVFNVGALIMSAIYREYGFVKLLALGHIQWLVMIPWLVVKVIPETTDTVLRNFFLAVVVFDTLSLILDGLDFYQFIYKGKKQITFVWDKSNMAAKQT